MMCCSVKVSLVLIVTGLLVDGSRADNDKPRPYCYNFGSKYLKAFHSIFNVYDIDKNGLISIHELHVGMNHNALEPVTMTDVEKVYKGFYFPGTCYADFGGFMHLFVFGHNAEIHFDENNVAYATYDVITRITKFLAGERGTNERADTFFRRCDVNKNGRMEIYEELLTCLATKDNKYDAIQRVAKADQYNDVTLCESPLE